MIARRPALLACAALVLAGVVTRSAGADDAEPRASVEMAPAVAGVGQPVTLVIEVTVEGLGGVELRPTFRLDNLRVDAGPGTTRMHNWVNGRSTSGTRLTWRLLPEAPGTAAVRDLRVEVDGRALTLPDREIRVEETAPAPPAPSRRPLDPFGLLMSEDPFAPFRSAAPRAMPKLRLSSEVSKRRVFVGEQLVWRLVLDTQADVSAFHPRQLPEFEGFWVRDLAPPERLRPDAVEVDGETFWRVAPVRRAVFPLRAGRFHWREATAEVVARIAEAGWIGPMARNESMSLSTNELDLEVLPLPEPPPGFTGAVGEVRVSAALDRDQVGVGQAATLTVTLSGTGHLARLAPAPLTPPPGLRALEPGAASSEDSDGRRLRTTLSWTYVLVADRPGSYRIVPPEMIWFDPESTAYRTAQAAPVVLSALPAAAADDGGGPRPAAAPDEPEGPPEGALREAALRALAGLGVLLAGGLVAARLARRGRPARKARRRLAAQLGAARACTDPAGAAVALEAAWRGWLAERWGVPAGIPVAHWPERLAAAGIPAPGPERLVELFRELHDLRYAPELADLDGLVREIHEHSDRLRRELA